MNLKKHACYQCGKVIGQEIKTTPDMKRILGVAIELVYNEEFGGMKDVYYKELVNGKRKVFFNNAEYCKECVGEKGERKYKEN